MCIVYGFQFQCCQFITVYDVAVFQWITSCIKKCYDYACINTFAGVNNVLKDVRNNSVNFHKKYDQILF